MPAEGGQSTSGPIYKKWGGGGGGGDSPFPGRYTKSGGGGGAVHFRSNIRNLGGGQSASGPIPSLLNEDFYNCLIGVRKL